MTVFCSLWLRLRLSTRLNLIIASVLFLTMAVFVALDYARERKALLDAEAERLATIGASAARRLPTLVSPITEDQLRSIASIDADRPVTVYFVRRGDVVLSSNPGQQVHLAPRKVRTGPSYDVWRTTTGLAVSIPFGAASRAPSDEEFFVEARLDSVNSLLRRTLRLHVIHGLATVLAMTLGVSWVLRRTIQRPFERMISAMNVMERGTWELDVPVSYQDEVGILTKAFNRMGKKLTRTALAFGRTERLAAFAFLSARLRQHLDAPFRDMDEVSSRLSQRGLSREELEAEAHRIQQVAQLARRVFDNLDDVFVAELQRAAISDGCRPRGDPHAETQA